MREVVRMLGRRVTPIAASAIAMLCVGSGLSAGTAVAAPGDQSVAYQVDPAHDGFINDTSLRAPLTQQWSLTLPGTVSYPLIVNGTVFVTAADSGAYGTTLYAINQASGTINWSRDLGGTYWWSGLAYDRGRLFVLNESGILTALDPSTGLVDWSMSLPGQYMFSSAPTAVRGIVYAGGAGSGGTLYAVRELDGHLLWTREVMNGDDSSPAVDATKVYVTYPCQYYAFNAVTGTAAWHYNGPCEGGGGDTPVVADGLLFVRDYTGAQLVLSTLHGTVLAPFAAGPTPAVANGTAYMLSGTTLKAVNAWGLGTNVWSVTGDGSLDSAPLVVGGLVYVGSSTGELFAFDPATGATVWSTNVGAAIGSANGGRPIGGLGAANGTLVVPAGRLLTEYRSAGTITSAPADLSAPTIDGPAKVGQILGADVGVWSGLPSAYAYQWRRCDGAGAHCVPIAGATHTSYKPAVADGGSTIRLYVTATNSVGSSSAAASTPTALVPPLPAIEAVSPNAGTNAGVTVTITGTALAPGAAVAFGTTSATSVTYVSPTELKVVPPYHVPGTVRVTVRTVAGTSVATNADLYAYGLPLIAAVSPTTGPTAGGNTVTITGTQFVPGAVVRFGTTAATGVTFVSPTKLTAVAPFHAAGKVRVSVRTPDGVSPSTASDGYLYSDPGSAG